MLSRIYAKIKSSRIKSILQYLSSWAQLPRYWKFALNYDSCTHVIIYMPIFSVSTSETHFIVWLPTNSMSKWGMWGTGASQSNGATQTEILFLQTDGMLVLPADCAILSNEGILFCKFYTPPLLPLLVLMFLWLSNTWPYFCVACKA